MEKITGDHVSNNKTVRSKAKLPLRERPRLFRTEFRAIKQCNFLSRLTAHTCEMPVNKGRRGARTLQDAVYFQVDLKHMDQVAGSNIVKVGIDLSEFYLSVEWDILAVPASRNEEYDPCCSEPYSGINI